MQRTRFVLTSILMAISMCTALAPAGAHAGSVMGAARNSLVKRALKPSPPPAAVKPRDVVIRRTEHPQAAEHIEQAQRTGQPTILHVDRGGAAERRHAAVGSVDLKRKPQPLYERDEYPPAMTREGGHNADVRWIDRHSNRGAGSSMRAQTKDLPDGARIRVLVAD